MTEKGTLAVHKIITPDNYSIRKIYRLWQTLNSGETGLQTAATPLGLVGITCPKRDKDCRDTFLFVLIIIR